MQRERSHHGVRQFTPPHGRPALQRAEEGKSIPKGCSPKPRASARGAGFTRAILVALCLAQAIPEVAQCATDSPPLLSDEQLLDRTEASAAKYFWNQAFSTNGFVRDHTGATYASTAATGLGLAALTVIAQRYGTSPAWTVTYSQARERALQILVAASRLQDQQARDPATYGIAGFLYHFLNANGTRATGSEVSTVDMALFLAGALTAGQYFNGDVATLANELFDKVQWDAFFDATGSVNAQSGQVEHARQFFWAWKPRSAPGACDEGYHWSPAANGCMSQGHWDRPTDEALLINLLALASQPNSNDPDTVPFQQSLYAWPRQSRAYQDHEVVNSYFGSLFTYLLGHMFFDFQAMGVDHPTDSSLPAVNWFENSRQAILANRQFTIDHQCSPDGSCQPDQHPTYSEYQWGLSACYRPDGTYFGTNGAQPAESGPSFDGTVPPYASISTMPLLRTSPSESLRENLAFQSLRHYYDTYCAGSASLAACSQQPTGLWGPYGPKDSLKTTLQQGNPVTQYAPFHLGINVGPEVLMMENYRSKLIQRLFMSHPAVDAAVRIQFPAYQLDQNQPPVFLKLGSRSIAEGTLLTMTLSASDLDGDPLTYRVVNLPRGATFTGTTFSWRPDADQAGTYPLVFVVTDGTLSDQQTVVIQVKDVPLAIVSVTATPSALSPNADGRKDVTTLSGRFNHTALWQLTITDVAGRVIQIFTGSGAMLSQAWDGTDTAGRLADDGTYTCTLIGTDTGGSSASKSGTVTLDTVAPTLITGITAIPNTFRPSQGETTTLSFTPSEPVVVSLRLLTKNGMQVRTLLGSRVVNTLPDHLTWDGKDNNGALVAAGTYTYKLWVDDLAGNRISPYPITGTVTVQ